MTWQPIETAPRDGSWFVIYRAGEEDSYEVGQYDPSIHERYVEASIKGLYRKEQYTSYEWRGFNNFHRATHWMPLRPPPNPPA